MYQDGKLLQMLTHLTKCIFLRMQSLIIRYPDQSLYTVDSVPNLVKKINNALLRADRISHSEGRDDTYWFAPLVADAEAGIIYFPAV